MLSCVIPTLNAARLLARAVTALDGMVDELVVADGGSRDGTPEVARALGGVVVASPSGRGRQMAAGIAATSGDWLLLLHADTVLSQGWSAVATGFMAQETARAGYFRFRLDTSGAAPRRLERLVDWRCRSFGLPYGDQGLLLPRSLLQQAGGMRPLPLMEDVDLARRLGRTRLVSLAASAVTSAERWERDGYLARSARNLCCLSLYFAGVPTAWIARIYG